ncbi:uncharacterized protein LOC100382152 [Zea mays]|uniref:ENTH/VHS family protein n=1 Tax=Zea mays TaxID=4577 RepID=K7UB83_MAIZE|nr:uncharacterized protein LOC100382152 [Zea mays]AQK38811.1 ENTH/VHS family protein [Zea mays]AQK38812.1 ENTH/VHS family protein [Zea mays]AQK38814.1 ENTH/VHS family protein [Zea mays]AQK38817.1 ENTH/VHS family protein [Zea mays]|eukprot:XP_008662137.1 uncharacterized protein LOC100382152 isoform X1 [Zea mays]
MAAAKSGVDVETRDGGGGGSFSEERFVDKLNKLNNTTASIQTLSHWCIFHRKRARRIVDTWEKHFSTATNDKKISFLFLSNDILQNSKRKGGDYVHEFWRVLPRLLKHFYENGGEEAKKLVARLIGIWDDRKVFGTRIESLKDGIFGDNPPIFDHSGNNNNSNPSSNPLNSKVGRKDSSTVLKKLAVGGMPEKIVTAYQSVFDQHFDEDTALNKCKSTVSVLENLKKDIDLASTEGDPPASTMISDLQEQETILKHCIAQLGSVDAARISLINQLKEALTEQESKSEVLRSQLQVARAEAEHAIQLRQRFGGAVVANGTGSSSSPLLMSPQLQSLNPAPSLAPPIGAAGDEPKRTAAAMADKLASLSAPVQVLSSIFSSFVATHGASLSSMNSGSPPRDQLSGAPPGFQVEKRPRLERTVLASDMGAPPFSMQAPRLQQPVGSMPTQAATQMNQAPGLFAPPPPPPLPPLLPPLLQQFGQSAGGMMGMGPFGMMAGSMPPPPPMSSIMPAGFPAPSGPPPPPLPPAQTQPQQQQQSPPQPPAPQQSAGFFQTSAGMGYFPAVQVQQSPSAQRQ